MRLLVGKLNSLNCLNSAQITIYFIASTLQIITGSFALKT